MLTTYCVSGCSALRPVFFSQKNIALLQLVDGHDETPACSTASALAAGVTICSDFRSRYSGSAHSVTGGSSKFVMFFIQKNICLFQLSVHCAKKWGSLHIFTFQCFNCIRIKRFALISPCIPMQIAVSYGGEVRRAITVTAGISLMQTTHQLQCQTLVTSNASPAVFSL